MKNLKDEPVRFTVSENWDLAIRLLGMEKMPDDQRDICKSVFFAGFGMSQAMFTEAGMLFNEEAFVALNQKIESEIIDYMRIKVAEKNN